MNQKIETIKKHFRENKKVYISCSITAITVGLGTFILTRGISDVQNVQKITQIGFRNEAKPMIINLIELSTQSKPVHLVGTERYFNSIHDAARKTGHSVTRISKQVNGHISDLNGDKFEFLEPAA